METERSLNDLKQRVETLEKIIFYGKYSDFTFDSLLEPNAKIILCAIDGEKINIPVNVRSTVRTVKAAMHEMHGMPWWRITLVYGGNIIDNHRSLVGMGMPANSIVYYRYNRGPYLYPPFESLSKSQRREIADDHYIYNEHVLARDMSFKSYLRRAKEIYNLEKRAHKNLMNYL